MLREARKKGLKAPVILMGADLQHLHPSLNYAYDNIIQVITTLYWPTEKTKRSKTQQRPVQMDLSWLIFHPKKLLVSVRNASKRSTL